VKQLIELIKKYRAESERGWTPEGGYKTKYLQGHSHAYDKCADDLEKLVQQGDKVIEGIENMIRVEDAAQHCPDCAVGEFCLKHDKAFWQFWGEVKSHLSQSSKPPKKPIPPRYDKTYFKGKEWLDNL